MSKQANEPRAAGASAQPSIRWNDEAMQTLYANICNVASTREEVSLFFGTNQSWQGGAKQVEVALHHRMLLNPFTAKRLHLLLSKVLAEYETRFGAIPIDLEGSAGSGNGAAPAKG